jgi:polysaccharide biosynthesis/export protein
MGRSLLLRAPLGLVLAAGLVAAASAQDNAIRIAPRDQVTVTVWNEPNYSGKYLVDPDGTFDYPPIGRIKAGGLTPRDVAASLTKVLGEKYLVNPQVTVELLQSARMKVLVSGAVHAPAAYQFVPGTRLLEVLLQAGSTTDDAGDEALIIPAGVDPSAAQTGHPDAASTVHVDLQALLSGVMKDNVQLHDGDTVIVPKAQPIYINGYVKSPGQYYARKGMTVEQAVTLAGGLSDQGTFRGLKIMRLVNGKKKELKDVKKTDLVMPGDTITVGRRIL